MIYCITDIADGKVVVDGNHPLAGVALVFYDVTVAEVRAASAEEITTAMCMVPVVITTTDCTDVRDGAAQAALSTCGRHLRLRGASGPSALSAPRSPSPPSSASICCGSARVVPRMNAPCSRRSPRPRPLRCCTSKDWRRRSRAPTARRSPGRRGEFRHRRGRDLRLARRIGCGKSMTALCARPPVARRRRIAAGSVRAGRRGPARAARGGDAAGAVAGASA